MSVCPCCSNHMLRHIRHQQYYWFCRHCWQEMPIFEQSPSSLLKAIRRTLPDEAIASALKE